MRKLILAPVLALVIISSCKKSGSAPSSTTGTISATIDGKNETFNTDALALNSSGNGIHSIVIAGYQGAIGSSDEIGFGITGNNAITIGTYNFSLTNSDADQLSMQYSQSGSIEYISDMNNVLNTSTVTITSLTSTNIRGTFNGTLALFSSTSSTTTKTVTNGKFNVNFR